MHSLVWFSKTDLKYLIITNVNKVSITFSYNLESGFLSSFHDKMANVN